ncbi:MAG: MerR family transcriptional regulator [Bifidobacteriaceae bacterium]|nr:MerR family transcriptional regulator [Bifidobacteriaceae bacterium]
MPGHAGSQTPIQLEYTTREAAQLVGLTARALRYYHQVGLLPEGRRGPGGQRIYTREQILMLLRIVRLSEMGLSLEEVADVLGGPPGTHRAEVILVSLDRALADRVGVIQAQRRVIRELLTTGSPVIKRGG